MQMKARKVKENIKCFLLCSENQNTCDVNICDISSTVTSFEWWDWLSHLNQNVDKDIISPPLQ